MTELSNAAQGPFSGLFDAQIHLQKEKEKFIRSLAEELKSNVEAFKDVGVKHVHLTFSNQDIIIAAGSLSEVRVKFECESNGKQIAASWNNDDRNLLQSQIKEALGVDIGVSVKFLSEVMEAERSRQSMANHG